MPLSPYSPPGRGDPPSSAQMARLMADLERLSRVGGSGEITVGEGGGGRQILDTRPIGFAARITGHATGNAYAFTRTDESTPDTFPDLNTDPVQSGDGVRLAAYELTGKDNVRLNSKVTLFPLAFAPGYYFTAPPESICADQITALGGSGQADRTFGIDITQVFGAQYDVIHLVPAAALAVPACEYGQFIDGEVTIYGTAYLNYPEDYEPATHWVNFVTTAQVIAYDAASYTIGAGGTPVSAEIPVGHGQLNFYLPGEALTGVLLRTGDISPGGVNVQGGVDLGIGHVPFHKKTPIRFPIPPLLAPTLFGWRVGIRFQASNFSGTVDARLIVPLGSGQTSLWLDHRTPEECLVMDWANPSPGRFPRRGGGKRAALDLLTERRSVRTGPLKGGGDDSE